MKRLMLLGLLMTTCLGMSLAQPSGPEVGENNDGTYTVTMSTTDLELEWEALLLNQGIQMDLATFSIQQVTEGPGSADYYLLVADNAAGTIHVATELLLDNDKFYFAVTGTTTETVVCQGCALGCNPKKGDNGWICSLGCGDNCTKTVTITTTY